MFSPCGVYVILTDHVGGNRHSFPVAGCLVRMSTVVFCKALLGVAYILRLIHEEPGIYAFVFQVFTYGLQIGMC